MVWEMDIRDPPWAQANFRPPKCKVCRRVKGAFCIRKTGVKEAFAMHWPQKRGICVSYLLCNALVPHVSELFFVYYAATSWRLHPSALCNRKGAACSVRCVTLWGRIGMCECGVGLRMWWTSTQTSPLIINSIWS